MSPGGRPLVQSPIESLIMYMLQHKRRSSGGGGLQSFLPSILRCLLNERTTPYYTGATLSNTNTSALGLSRIKAYKVLSSRTLMDDTCSPDRPDESSHQIQPWLPAAVGPGRSDTVMSGGN